MADWGSRPARRGTQSNGVPQRLQHGIEQGRYGWWLDGGGLPSTGTPTRILEQ